MDNNSAHSQLSASLLSMSSTNLDSLFTFGTNHLEFVNLGLLLRNHIRGQEGGHRITINMLNESIGRRKPKRYTYVFLWLGHKFTQAPRQPLVVTSVSLSLVTDPRLSLVRHRTLLVLLHLA
ncbi:hypothetical protein L2E82_00334 [Cichorium intybus]|uniref:Uncharacterized protein n=1 Tax=Cichorium intybus TaxID=13427 RepID=A0ACB9GW94_CICIN|nr:hypothetical protein L2E82_00334 [Cichorium intybus]